MSAFKQITAAALIVGASVLTLSGPAESSAFVAWRVSGVAENDLLNVRAYPGSKSRILVGYPNGARLSMTGKCTGDIRIDEIQGQPAAKQRQTIRFNWCEAWVDPAGDGEFRTGWVYGRFIRPD